jgi:hypothetical protein
MKHIDRLANVSGQLDAQSAQAIQVIFFQRPRFGRGGQYAGGQVREAYAVGGFIAFLPARPTAAVVVDPTLGEQLLVGKKAK